MSNSQEKPQNRKIRYSAWLDNMPLVTAIYTCNTLERFTVPTAQHWTLNKVFLSR